MDAMLIVSVCGTCSEADGSGHPLDACPWCGADYSGGAPELRLWMGTTADGIGVAVSEEWLGDWDPNVRAAAMRAAWEVIDGG